MRPNLTLITALATALAASSVAAQSKRFTVDADFNTGTLNNVSLTPSNQLGLGRTPVSMTHIVWSTNYYPGWVVRMDSLTGKQTARFDSALATINGVATGARPSGEFCNWSNLGNCPGRVGVDSNADVWIINRAFGNQGTLTKFSGNVAHCIDRNNNGIIDTSRDLNNDGLIDMNPANGEYFGQNDECILATIPVGGVNAWPRGVAVDKYGKIWVGTFNEGKLYRFNPNEPIALEMTVNIGPSPYSLATGGDYLFVSNNGGAGGTKRVHITTGAVTTAPCPATYALVADPSGQVAWLGGYPSGLGLYRADFATNPTTCTLTSNGLQVTAVTLDAQPAPGPYVWTANYSSSTVSKYSMYGTLLSSYPAGGSAPHGLSVDFQGNLWVVIDTPPQMVKLNATTGTILGTYSLGGPSVPNSAPYLYGDFTGTQIDRQAPYTYQGSWEGTYDGTRAGLAWSKVTWNTEAQGAVPALTSLTVSARAADTLAALGTAAYAPVTNGAALSSIAGRYIQVRAAFRGPGFVTPVLSDITVSGPCAAIGNACCVQDSDCADADACTADSCPVAGQACVHAAIASCCHTVADCVAPDACSDAACPSDGAACVYTPRANCCLSNADCADADACTRDTCSGPGGTCSHAAVFACCNTASDCSSAGVCLSTSCPAPGGVCTAAPISGCCSRAADCADSDPCTADTCNAATGVCSNVAVANCCRVNGDCDDGKACTADTCSGPGGVCSSSPIAGCCMTADDCPADACATSVCSGPGGHCVVTPKANCCRIAADCADQNPCTVDACPTAGGKCQNTMTAGCCVANADCDDGNRCTKDTCSFAGGACAHEAIAGCCTEDADCQGGTCVNAWCVAAPAAEPDAGTEVVKASGCGCQTGAPVPALWALGILLAAALRRRSFT
jgi:MYXO-CTERM domain-containing protein